MMSVPLLCLANFVCILWIVMLKLENAQLKTDMEKVKKQFKRNLVQMTNDVSVTGGANMTRREVDMTDERIGSGHRV
jgi:hypothetical protein